MQVERGHSVAAERSFAKSVSTWAHVKYAVGKNYHLGRKVGWLLGVDWLRNNSKFEGYGSLDRLFHTAFCWEWWAVAHFRFAHWAHKRVLPDLSRFPVLERLMLLQQAALLRFCYASGKIVEGLSGARLAPGADVGPGLFLVHTGSCGIGHGTRIGCNFTMYQDANIVAGRGGNYPVIGDNVTLYSGARVIGPVNVGDNARIGANAVVLHDLPAGCVAVGSPAKPVRTGEHAGPHPAASQLEDLLTTLVESGALEVKAPGHYLDNAAGKVITIHFLQQ